jgi:pimeloyl-ACP methyl ester carboxylesterase
MITSNLYYEVQGSGPVLLVLQGGDGDANGMRALVGELVGTFTVVTYDRRGLSRSAVTEGAPPPTMETHADDAALVLEAVTREPAFVLGSSIGALIGLHLVARHPDKVKRLIAHEPPSTQFLAESERAAASQSQADIEDAFRKEGLPGAMRKFAAIAGLDFNDREPDVEPPMPTPQRIANLTFFLTHDAPAVRTSHVDEAALDRERARIVVGVGKTSSAHLPGRCARGLAALLHAQPEEFAGGHNGAVTHPKGFAKDLRRALA